MTTTTTTNNSPLSTTNNNQETSVTPTMIVEQCSSCKSTKRKALSQFLENQENDQHLSKKPNLSELSTQFTNIHISSPDALRRTFSAPISPPVKPFFTPENDSKKAQALLQRCVSDPTPVLGFPVTFPESKIGNETPKTNTCSLPPRWNSTIRRRRRIEADRMRRKRGDGATSEDKVKKMKEIIGVTTQWLTRISQQDEQGSHVAQIPKGKENETEEEAVSVEKTGECLVIEFKCNCSKTYHVLLSQDACYYKLI